MPPITTFANSPIVAAKPSGVTPQTAAHDGPVRRPEDGPPSTTTTAPAGSSLGYPAAQPGARPPAPTGTTSAYTPAGAAPAPTRTTAVANDNGPAPPQPGNVPIAPSSAYGMPQPTGSSSGARSNLPPPPKAGEKFVPPQMGIPPPTGTYPAQQTGTMPSSGSESYQGGLAPANLGGYLPPGYQAPGGSTTGPGRYQPSPMAADPHDSYHDGESEGIWNTAKKWASDAGEKLASAESEVWKRINKE